VRLRDALNPSACASKRSPADELALHQDAENPNIMLGRARSGSRDRYDLPDDRNASRAGIPMLSTT